MAAAATLVHNNDQINIPALQPILFDPQLFSISNLDDETEVDGTIATESPEKETPHKPTEVSTPLRPWSNLSMSGSSANTNRKARSRSYQFIQLEHALTSAGLLKLNDDRVKFENEYLHSIREKTFEKFLEKNYEKIRDHYEEIKRERQAKKARVFSIFDLEKNFLALDPSRDVKIIFIDEPSASTITKTSSTRPSQRSTSAAIASEAAVETFYAKRSHLLLPNPSRARDEVTLFARRNAERLHERLPRLTTVPHRVKIVDERDTTGKPDDRTVLQMKHKHALSLVNKRRHVLLKMIAQTKKNQMKMEEQWTQPTFAIDSSACCRELLERANQIEDVVREREQQVRQQQRRPQTAMVSRSIPINNRSSATPSDVTITNTNLTTLSSKSIPYQDALSIDQMQRTRKVRVLASTRPLTAPIKVNWTNYC